MAKRIRAKKRHLWAAKDGRRAVLAALMLVFVVATSLSDGTLIPDAVRDRLFAGSRAPTEPGDDLKTGTILITPPDGNLCEFRLIDNATWRIRPNGTMPCDEAVARQALRNGGYTAITRLEAIRDGFFSKR